MMNRRRAQLVVVVLAVLALVAVIVAPLLGGADAAPAGAKEHDPHTGPGLQAAVVGAIEPYGEVVERTARIEEALPVWFRIADCESGDWDADATPLPGTARWDYGTEPRLDVFEGGLNFHPATWESYRDPDMPGHAGEASALDQILVAERVQDDQGWQAWPVCSELVGAG